MKCIDCDWLIECEKAHADLRYCDRYKPISNIITRLEEKDEGSFKFEKMED